MRRPCFFWLLLGLVLPSVPACVELTGQRITWSYETVKDEIQVHLFYDGIHDSGSNQYGNGREQIPQFVKDGDFMFWDWPLHWRRPAVQQLAEDPATKPLNRDWLKLILLVRSETIGRYRTLDGRIGVLQRLTIPGAKDFVRRANELISRSILESAATPSGPLPRTHERVVAAAKAGHVWLALEGQSLRITVPCVPNEWSRTKAQLLKAATQYVSKAFGEKGAQEDQRRVWSVIRCLASAPLSCLDEGDRIQFIIGRRAESTTVRLTIRDKYEPNLEQTVEAAVPTDFDKAVAQSLLGQGETPPAVAAALRLDVPEASVGALIRWAKAGDDAQKAAVARRLESWAEKWNRDHGFPQAPKPNPVLADYIAAWESWCVEMAQFPLREIPAPSAP